MFPPNQKVSATIMLDVNSKLHSIRSQSMGTVLYGTLKSTLRNENEEKVRFFITVRYNAKSMVLYEVLYIFKVPYIVLNVPISHQ